MNAQTENSTSPPCVLCGHQHTLLQSEGETLAVWRCPSCRTDFTFPASTAELFLSRGKDADGNELAGEFLGRFERKGETLSLLDIGCGDGSRLSTALARGWKCFGVEPSDTARASAQKSIGTIAFLTDHVDHLIPHAFDVILLINVLEQCPDPVSLFYTLFARGAIQPQTTIVISTRNAPSLDLGASPLDGEAVRFISFSVESLKQMLAKLRFNPVEVSVLPGLTGERTLFLPVESSESDNSPSDWVDIVAIASGSDFHSFMKERYVPGTWSELALYEHFPRYQLAGSLAHRKTILDLGCGTGYGTALLARKGAASVLGLDIDQSTIEWAERAHRENNLSFCVRSDLGAGFASESFDLITCFEMIEHVTEPVQRATIASVARLLKKNGVLLISTPNPVVTKLYGENPFHLREMTGDEFLALLSDHFKHIRLNYQFIHAGTLITPEVQTASANARMESMLGTHQRSPAAAFIAVCSNEPLPDIPVTNFVDNADLVRSKMRTEDYINRLQIEHFKVFEAAAAARAQVEQQSREVQNLGRTLTARDSQLKILDEDIQRLNLAIGNLSTDNRRLNADIQRLNADIQRLNAYNQQSNADNRRLNADIQRLNAYNQQSNADNQQLRRELAETAAKLEGLEESSLVRLERTIRDERWSVRKAGKIATIVATIARNQLRAHFPSFLHNKSNPPNVIPQTGTKISAAYLVKQPQPVTRAGQRPRILYALANFMTGGTSRLVVDLIEHLGDHYDQEVLTSFIPSPPAYEGVTIREFRHLDSPSPVLEELKRFRPDILHVHYWGDCDEPWYRQVFLAAEQFGCVIIQNVNTPVTPFNAPVFRNVYVSDYVLDTFGPGDHRGLVINPGSNFELFTRENLSDIPDDWIGMVYRLEKDKLDQRAIEPFIEVVRRRPRTRVLIIGGGTFQEPYMEAVREAGLEQAFEFPGYVAYDLLPNFYRRLSVFVAPVWKESFGQVGPFAMNMGLPVVGYNVGAIADIIDDQTLVAPPGDSAVLASIIIRLLDNRKERLLIGSNNIKRARLLFSIDPMIASYRKLYQEALESRKNPG
jgi:2-polyprenyl-3-methyl-5-hydroxy-6-metoxy-1,4-benzoquinol methylase/glycosyltransferase involved in cell wall biosynthesis